MALHPVGPLPAATYWRRRLVLLGFLVVLVLVVRSCASGGEKEPAADPSPTPRPSASASARATATATGACTDAQLALTVAGDTATYAVGSSARFTVTVRNASRAACRRDLGGRALEVVVQSGADRIWSSDDCSADTAGSVQLLRPGASLKTTVTWAGTRSRPGCTGSRVEARPGTYTVRARLGTLRSPASVFRVTR